MWPFSRPKEDDSVADRLSTVVGRLGELESQVRLLKTEWLDTLDRLERIAGRLAKRAEREEGKRVDDAVVSPPTTGSVVARIPLTSAQRIALRRGHF